MVSFELFARPALRRMAGHAELAAARGAGGGRRGLPPAARRQGPLRPGRRRRADDDGVLQVRSAGGQGSHQLTAMARANALLPLPDGDGVDGRRRGRVLLLADV